MATRTAPLATAVANLRSYTIHLIDASGDLWTEEIDLAVGALGSAIETWVNAYQLATQASVYMLTDTLIRSGAPVRANADAGARSGGECGINITFKDFTTFETFPGRLVAPQGATMEGNTDTVDITDTLFTDLRDAYLALLTGASFASAQYTVHRERKNNTRVKG